MVASAVISRFSGEHCFLSNFYPAEVLLDGETYRTVEHAFQAAKVLSPQLRSHVRQLNTPRAARRIGRMHPLRADWADIKVKVMLALLRQKFSDPMLGGKLLATGSVCLVEGNDWGDTFWGAVDGKGKNMLGMLLHIVRYELRRGLLRLPSCSPGSYSPALPAECER